MIKIKKPAIKKPAKKIKLSEVVEIKPPVKKALPEILTSICESAEQNGVFGLSIGFRDEQTKELVVHFHKVIATDAVNLGGHAWTRAIQLLIEKHPEWSEERKNVFNQAVEEFKGLINKINDRLATLD